MLSCSMYRRIHKYLTQILCRKKKNIEIRTTFYRVPSVIPFFIERIFIVIARNVIDLHKKIFRSLLYMIYEIYDT